MSLQELVGENAVAVVDREAPRTEPGTYTPDADAYGLFCEQYLEKPTLSEEEAGKAVASYGMSTYFVPGTNDEDDD